jgi:endonuclease III
MQSADATRSILEALRAQHPGATTELTYGSPYELLVATILSAQTTDQRVNQATPALFRQYPDSAALSAADPAAVERLVRPTGFFRQKARALVGVARALMGRHGGTVPTAMAALVQLPGVGRKTANVVLGHALGVPGFAVDRHVLRVTNRIGMAESSDPDTVEAQVTAALRPEDWTVASDTLILHGRRICKPRPLCDRCAVRRSCHFAQAGGASPRDVRPVSARKSRRVSPATARARPGRSRRPT